MCIMYVVLSLGNFEGKVCVKFSQCSSSSCVVLDWSFFQSVAEISAIIYAINSNLTATIYSILLMR